MTAQETLASRLDVLIDEGLMFGTVVGRFAARRSEDELSRVDQAIQMWTRDGEIEVDRDAIVSESADEGDYVMAWVWVPDPDTDD